MLKNKTSFNRIPKEAQETFRQYLGKVAFQFVCDKVDIYYYGDMSYPTPAYDGDPSMCDCGYGYYIRSGELKETCLTYEGLEIYGRKKTLYGYHISDLNIYDKPKELGAYKKPCSDAPNTKCYPNNCPHCGWNTVTRPPQSWCYVEELME